MLWQSDWKAIAARIAAVVEAGRLFAEAQQNDHYGTINTVLLPQAREVLSRVSAFMEKYRAYLPPEVAQAFARHEKQLSKPLDGNNGFPGALATTVIFTAMQGELNHLLSVSEVTTIAAVERAFQHLQRSIIADDDFAGRWRKAFDAGEVACEKLGAVHLLSHAIWAFKADARGERSDLILGSRIDGAGVSQTGSVLTLTEWKRVRDAKNLDDAIAKAVKQARLYAGGSLGSVELQSCRYVVVVTEDRMRMPDDHTNDGITYRHVNIAVAPSTPSRSSV